MMNFVNLTYMSKVNWCIKTKHTDICKIQSEDADYEKMNQCNGNSLTELTTKIEIQNQNLNSTIYANIVSIWELIFS